MEDQFTQKVKATLDNPPTFPFDEGQWQALDRRLRPQQRGAGWWATALALLLLALLPTGLWWSSQQQLADTEARLNALERRSAAPASSTRTDTVRNTVILYDTIYRTVVVSTVQSPATAPVHSPLPSYLWPTDGRESMSMRPIGGLPLLSDGRRSGAPLSLRPLALLPDLIGTAPTSPDLIGAPASPTTTDADMVAVQPLPSVLTLLGQDAAAPLPDFQPPISADVRRLHPLAYYWQRVRPTQVGAAGHVAVVGDPRYGTDNVPGFATGVAAHIGYGDHWRLTLGGTFLSWNLKREIDDNEVPTDEFPIAAPDAPSDVLHEIYGRFRYLQVPVGLEYVFFKSAKFRPMLGVAAVAQRPLASQLEYEYMTGTTEYKLTTTDVLPTDWSLSHLRLTLGGYMGHHPRRRFFVLGSAQWDTQSGGYSYQHPLFISLTAGIHHQF